MMETNDYFIKNTLRKYLIPTIFAILGTTAASFFNTLFAGRTLGKEALAAMNLLSSFTFLFAMLGCLINIGASACASVEMGKGSDRRVGEYEMYAFAASILLPFAVSLLLLLFFRPFMYMLGADEALYDFMREYAVIVLIFGFLTTVMYFPFNFLRLDGRAGQAMAVFTAMSVLDVVLLLLFLRVGFGLPGVAWASVISTGAADLAGILLLFFGKGRQIQPVLPKAGTLLYLTGQTFQTGAAAGLNNLCNMLRTLVMNGLVLKNLGTAAASEFAVACSLISFASASVFGCGQTVAPLVGVFYGEHDLVSIRILIKKTNHYAVLIHSILFLLLVPAAVPLAKAFGMKDSQMVSGAAMGLRFAALSLIPAAVLNVYIYYYTAVRELMALVLTFLRAFGLVVVYAVFLFALGLDRWYMASFVLAEFTAFGCMFWMCAYRRKKQPGRKGLLLLDDAENAGEQILSFSVPGTPDGAVAASQKMEQLCEENEVSPRFSMLLPLALEELLVIINEHCLLGDQRKYADVRIRIRQDAILLRIRCGGRIFDPMDWYRRKKESMTKEELLEDDTLGIRLIDEKAKSITFKRTLGVNNLIVEL